MGGGIFGLLFTKYETKTKNQAPLTNYRKVRFPSPIEEKVPEGRMRWRGVRG